MAIFWSEVIGGDVITAQVEAGRLAIERAVAEQHDPHFIGRLRLLLVVDEHRPPLGLGVVELLQRLDRTIIVFQVGSQHARYIVSPQEVFRIEHQCRFRANAQIFLQIEKRVVRQQEGFGVSGQTLALFRALLLPQCYQLSDPGLEEALADFTAK